MRLSLNSKSGNTRSKDIELQKVALMPLEFLNPGDCADIEEVTGEPGWVGRLAELGVSTGSRVLVVRAGSPCLIELRGVRLSLRSGLRTQIMVRPIARADTAIFPAS